VMLPVALLWPWFWKLIRRDAAAHEDRVTAKYPEATFRLAVPTEDR